MIIVNMGLNGFSILGMVSDGFLSIHAVVFELLHLSYMIPRWVYRVLLFWDFFSRIRVCLCRYSVYFGFIIHGFEMGFCRVLGFPD
jgi:hypothetical protein